jgi:hypothetical protein
MSHSGRLFILCPIHYKDRVVIRVKIVYIMGPIVVTRCGGWADCLTNLTKL